jgi:hypothetical protein
VTTPRRRWFDWPTPSHSPLPRCVVWPGRRDPPRRGQRRATRALRPTRRSSRRLDAPRPAPSGGS